jgi:peptide/nickel transport system substrate-binding protein
VLYDVRLCFCAIAILTLALSGCSRIDLRSGQPPTAWGAPHVLRIGMVGDPYTLNPLFANDQTSTDIGTLYTETLITLDGKNQLMPLVATRVPTRANGDIARDGLTITYHLRHDNRFADGVLLTSRDVMFTYKAIMDPRNPVSSAEPYHQINSIDTPDPYTVRIHLRKRWAAAVSELFAASDTAIGILPAHAFANDPDIAHAEWNQHPFGSGPFRVVSWRHDDEIVLEPNPYALRRPHLRQVIIKIIPDSNSLFIALRTHAIDIDDGLTPRQVKQVQMMNDLHLIRTPLNATAFLEFETQRFPTNDPRVRRAIIEAIDHEALLKKIYLGLQSSATTEIPPMLWAHDYALNNLPYSPRQAAAELDAAGWTLQGDVRMKNGKPLEITLVSPSGGSMRMSTFVQAQLRVVGIRSILRGYPVAVLTAPASAGGIYSGGRFNISVDAWVGGSDPEASEYLACDQRPPKGSNYTGWCDARYDRLFALQRTNGDQRVRRNAFLGMQRLVHDAYVEDFLAYGARYFGVNPSLVNFHPNMLYEFWNSDKWDVPQGRG